MGLVLENRLIQDLQLRVLQEFFKIQMQAAFGDGWKNQVEQAARRAESANNNDANKKRGSNYRGILHKINSLGIQTFDETSMDITALYALICNDFRRQCSVGSGFYNKIDAIRIDKNALVSHLSNFSAPTVNKLIYQSLENIGEFLKYLKNSNWNYADKLAFVNKYSEEIKELTGEEKKKTLTQKLKKLPFSKLQEIVDDEEVNTPEADLEMYIRLKNGYVNEEDYDGEKAKMLLERAVQSGLAEAEARLALDIYRNKDATEEERYRADRLLGSAARKGSSYVNYVYGHNAQYGTAGDEDEINYESAFEYYCKAANDCLEAAVRKAYCMAMDIGVENKRTEGRNQLIDLAETTQDGFAYYFLGVYYLNTEQYEKAFKVFKKAYAKTRDNGSGHELALCYLYGYGADKNQEEAFEIFKTLSNKGYARSKTMLGECYLYGYGVEKDSEEALRLFKDALRLGDKKNALLYIGIYYYEKGDKKALEYFSKAEELNSNLAIYYKGLAYYKGVGIEKNLKEAFNCFKKAAEKGSVSAEYMLGECYYYGLGVDKNLKEAFNCFKKATEKGSASAEYMLGECYCYGLGVDKNEEKAAEHFKQVTLSNAGASYYSKAAVELGTIYHKNLELSKAFEKFKQGAALKNGTAQYWLGIYNLYGYGESKEVKLPQWYKPSTENEGKPEYQRAFWWFEQAANNGYDSKVQLAYCYYYGIGTLTDKSEALRLFAQLNEYYKGYRSRVKCMLGLCLDDKAKQTKSKDTREQMEKKAFECFESAAQEKEILAQYMLGIYYYFGKGTLKNNQKAKECFEASIFTQSSLEHDLHRGVKTIPPDVVAKIEDIAEVESTVIADSNFMLGVCYGNMHQQAEAKKYYKAAAEKGHKRAKLMLEYLDIVEKGVTEEDLERLKFIGKAGIIGAKDQFIKFMFSHNRSNELEDVCIENRWFDELVNFYINNITNISSFMFGTPMVTRRYNTAVSFIKKAKQAGYENAEAQLKRANEVYEKYMRTNGVNNN